MAEPIPAVRGSGIYLFIFLAHPIVKSPIDIAARVSSELSGWANLPLNKQHKGSWIRSYFLKGIQSSAGN